MVCKILTIGLLITSVQANAADPDDFLVAHWTLNQADFQNGLHQDGTANDHDADPQAPDPNYVEGKVDPVTNGAVEIRGVNYASGGVFDPSAGTKQFTASAWIKWDGTARSGIVSKRDSWADDNMMWQLEIQPIGGIGVLLLNSPISSHLEDLTHAVPADTWVFACVTYDGASSGDGLTGEAKLYQDGALIAANPAYTIASDTTAAIQIGVVEHRTPTPLAPFAGVLDDVKIYSAALTPEEVVQAYYDVTGESVCSVSPPYDVTGPEGEPDCIVDLFDLAGMASNWLTCTIIPSSECN